MARVLIVDDALFIRTVLREILSGAGHDVVGEAANGDEAVELYERLRPDIVTLDITMPVKDGLAALRDIVAGDPNARVVMCSALGQESKVLESIRGGASSFIVKPFRPERVVSAIDDAMAA